MAKAASALVLCLVGCMAAQAEYPDKQAFEVIQRGRYLATAADCTACHTAVGGKPFAGGRAVETPFGKLIAPNITPDPTTGIGAWTDDEFVRAIRDGIGHGGIHLYPAMPYTYYTRMTPQDVIAIRAYLNTVDPVRNPVQANQLPFPFDIRASMAGWDKLFFTPGAFKPAANKSAEWNRGAYLVEGAEHCGMCHTPKNALGGDESGQAYQGYALQGWFAPNLTGNRRVGLGTWSVDDIVLYLKTGRNRFDIASGPMAEAVSDSTSHLTNPDLRAMAVYLKTLPSAGHTPKPLAANDPVMQDGKSIYIDQCAACHTMQGAGIVGLFPKLSSAPLVQEPNATSLVRVVLAGSQAVATDEAPTGPAMPSFAWKLNDREIAAVVTYIRNSWGNAASEVSADDVQSARHTLRHGAAE
ncbi:MAG TPA: cytochrome c [Rhodopila sp.]|nr:cytochrome c [Rhodopila sp.]